VVFAQDTSSLDPGGDIGDVAGLAQWWFLSQGLVRAVAVIVAGVFGKDLAEVLLAEDQHVWGARSTPGL
jgi:hypothetical protein